MNYARLKLRKFSDVSEPITETFLRGGGLHERLGLFDTFRYIFVPRSSELLYRETSMLMGLSVLSVGSVEENSRGRTCRGPSLREEPCAP